MRKAGKRGTLSPTLGELVRAWHVDVDARFDLSDSTKRLYGRVGRNVCRWGADRRVGSAVVHGFAMARRSRVAPRTLALEVRVLGICLRWAVRAGYLRTLPAFPRIPVDPRRFVINHRTPTPTEVGRVLNAMPDDDWRVAVGLLARTGARVGEVVGLRATDFDAAGGMLALGATEASSKTGLRWFPLDATSRLLLARRRGGERLLDLPAKNAREALRRRLTRACARAGVPRFTPHGLRRMVVGRLLRARVDPAVAASLTGHSVTVMLRHYRQVLDEDRRDAVRLARLGDLPCDGTLGCAVRARQALAGR